MRIGIVGAGAGGLAAGRHCHNQHYDFEIFEQTGLVGGTWNYTDRIDFDENGLEIHSSMYQGLITNLPKEVMAYEDFPYSEDIERSYIEQWQVLEYLNNFAKQTKILPFIKFFTRVTKIEPIDKNRWSIELENVKNKLKEIKQFDAVIICNGHYKDPIYPKIIGLETFSGRSLHSHYYRKKEDYRNRKVLVIGAGPSGVHISQQLSTVADKVYLCHKMNQITSLPETVVQKPLLKQLNINEAEFVDGSKVEINEIIFCTGYKYSFPFLTDECRINVDNNYVSPLYKHLINIEHPMMAFLGLPFQVCPFPLFDIQARFFLATLENPQILPTKDAMLDDLKREWLRKSGIEKKHFHRLGEEQGNYFDELSRLGGIKPISSVVNELYYYVRKNRNLDDKFRLIDDERYEKL